MQFILHDSYNKERIFHNEINSCNLQHRERDRKYSKEENFAISSMYLFCVMSCINNVKI